MPVQRSYLWPALIVVGIVLLSWSMVGTTGWPSVIVLWLLGAALITGILIGGELSTTFRWCIFGAIVALSLIGLYLITRHDHEAIHALAFIFAVGGAASLLRRWKQEDAMRLALEQRERRR